MREAVILDAVRTPVGRRGGLLREWQPTDLLAHTLTDLIKRNALEPRLIDDVIAGCTFQRGEQTGNVARTALLGAGLPESVPGTTIDRQCGSGQQAVHFATQAVRAGDYAFAIGCGVESMSRVELGPLFDPSAPTGEWYGERLKARYDGALPPQGVSAEWVIEHWGSPGPSWTLIASRAIGAPSARPRVAGSPSTSCPSKGSHAADGRWPSAATKEYGA